MKDSLPKNITHNQYLALKKEVDDLYTKMMEMHFQNKRDASYANTRSAYMEKRNLLQQVLALYPQYEKANNNDD